MPAGSGREIEVILYVDTSAVVKLLIEELGTEAVEAWFEQAEQVASSVITYAEACAALSRNHRRLESDPSRLSEQVAALDDQWLEYLRLPVAERPAGQLALVHELRGMDAVQLAAAVTLRARVLATAPATEVVFAAFDRRLLEAAEREGFATLGGPLE
jgi:predicted nucleic acid-binding protein